MKKHFHFIGIGGIGMSALARILHNRGEKVTGSDVKDSARIDELKREGIKITIGHSKKNIRSPNIVIYSTDIPESNEEVLFAKQKKIPLLHRSELLAQILEGYAPILVAGTHGKTTTASLIAHLMMEANLDPSYAIGGYLNNINSNGRFGKGVYFIVEADESDGTFLRYPSFGAVVTNLEHDHMYFWKNEKALLEAFTRFAKQVGSRDHFFWCYDDMLLKSLDLGGYSYGFDERADLVIENFCQIGWKMVFDISFEKKVFRNLEISLIGAHNVLNAAAAFGIGYKLDISEKSMRNGLASFQGVGRRVEKKGMAKEIEVYDDYAHHPTEIFATLRALKKAIKNKRIVLVFQPHRYSRTLYCLDDFADAFKYADEVILTDIYAAQEPPIAELTPEKIINRIKADGYPSIQFVQKDLLSSFLTNFLRSNDVLITMGAGDITHVGPEVLERLKA